MGSVPRNPLRRVLVEHLFRASSLRALAGLLLGSKLPIRSRPACSVNIRAWRGRRPIPVWCGSVVLAISSRSASRPATVSISPCDPGGRFDGRDPGSTLSLRSSGRKRRDDPSNASYRARDTNQQSWAYRRPEVRLSRRVAGNCGACLSRLSRNMISHARGRFRPGNPYGELMNDTTETIDYSRAYLPQTEFPMCGAAGKGNAAGQARQENGPLQAAA